VEGSASAPTHPAIELEPPGWQPRAIWVSARLLCGAAAFFFVAFVFAYFYLRSLDTHNDWKIGSVHPSLGLGIVILVVLIISALAMRMAATNPELVVPAGTAALLGALLTVVLQVIQWTTLGFGPASGGYASVFIGWTALYAVFTLPCAFWIETQIATVWRRRREGVGATAAQVLTDTEVVIAGLRACSFFWTFYVFIGVVTFVLLYVL
jgi:heme/copper-type cytochrome/quinol oxidase subunit 3